MATFLSGPLGRSVLMPRIYSHLVRRVIRNWRVRRMIRNTHSRCSKTDSLIGVVGPQWLKTMVYSVTCEPKRGQIPKVVIVGPISDNDPGSQVKVLLDEKNWTQVPTIGYRITLPKSLSAEPIVATRLTNPVIRLIPRGVPADIKLLAASASGKVVLPETNSIEQWFLAAERIDQERRWAMSSDVERLVNDALDSVGIKARKQSLTDVALICVTNRPENTSLMLGNLNRQFAPNREVVLVLNAPDFDESAIRRALQTFSRVTILERSPEVPLGQCLNTAMANTDARVVAKFDDDDCYCTNYLDDMVSALSWSGAAVVGKHSYLAYLEFENVSILRFPGHEWSFTGYIAGGTIVVDRQAVPKISFQHQTLGEDTSFLADVEKQGGLILSTGAMGFVQLRHGANTWVKENVEFKKNSSVIGSGDIRQYLLEGETRL